MFSEPDKLMESYGWVKIAILYLKPGLNDLNKNIFSFQLLTEFYQNQFSLLVPQF